MSRVRGAWSGRAVPWRPLWDLLRPGTTSVGIVVPVVVVLTALAVLLAIFGQAVVPWAIYPAL
jgi:hypothetical protein